MATKKLGRERAPQSSIPGRDEPQKNLFAWRGSNAFKVWLDELAILNGAPVAVTVDQAVTEYARKLGHRWIRKRV
jgi:hypothetical protein